MFCPVCDVELKMAERSGVEIDYCPHCRGVWLDRGELDKIVERSPLVQEMFSAPAHAGFDYEDDDAAYEKRKRGYQDVHDRRHDKKRDKDKYERRKKSKTKKMKDFAEDMFDLFD